MGKLTRIVFCGPTGVGKTSLIQQCIYGNYNDRKPEDFYPTIEDTYHAVVDTERGTKEKIRIYDLGGKSVIERHFINCADAFVLVYDLNDASTLTEVQQLRRQLESERGKREILFVLCGNKSDKSKDRACDQNELSRWAQQEKTHLCETSVYDRSSVCNALSSIVSHVTQSQGKGGFFSGKKDVRPFKSISSSTEKE